MRVVNSPHPSTAPSIYLSQVLGKPVLDANGERVATVRDLIVRFGGEPHPPISGMVAREGKRDIYLDWEQVADISPQGAKLSTFKVDLRPFQRRDGEAMLRRDILDKQLIDVDGRRLIRANDLQLAYSEGQYRLVGVDVSVQGLLRRLGPSRLTGSIQGRRTIDWGDVESFATDVPMVRLRVSHEGLSKLHPVDIAHIVDALSYRQGQEILESLDDETAADTVQEMDPEAAAELMEGLNRERAADILDEMDPDDAADLLADLPEESAQELLGLMEPDESDAVRELLTYEEDTAGGLMTTDYVAMPRDITAHEALARLRALEEPPAPLYHVYTVEAEGSERLSGVVSLRDLVIANSDRPLASLEDPDWRFVNMDEPARDVARLMAEYNLAAVPVVDGDGNIQGVVLVDDAMDVLHPDLWTRRLSRVFHK